MILELDLNFYDRDILDFNSIEEKKKIYSIYEEEDNSTMVL